MRGSTQPPSYVELVETSLWRVRLSMHSRAATMSCGARRDLALESGGVGVEYSTFLGGARSDLVLECVKKSSNSWGNFGETWELRYSARNLPCLGVFRVYSRVTFSLSQCSIYVDLCRFHYTGPPGYLRCGLRVQLNTIVLLLFLLPICGSMHIMYGQRE